MQRSQFEHAGLVLSYLDSGGNGPVVAIFHAHWMEASSFNQVAQALAPEYRVLALDQRGHGHSAHAKSYTRDDYISDMRAWFDHLDLNEPLVLLGHSLGGVNAYQFAARYPNRVRALIIEDIGVVIETSADFIQTWSGVYPTRDALAERIGDRLAPYLQPEFRQAQDGWTLAFSPEEIAESQRQLCGDHWCDWLATDCPALLIRGADSSITSAVQLDEMARRRQNTTLLTLKGGHMVHVDSGTAFISTVTEFVHQVAPAPAEVQ